MHSLIDTLSSLTNVGLRHVFRHFYKGLNCTHIDLLSLSLPHNLDFCGVQDLSPLLASQPFIKMMSDLIDYLYEMHVF